MSVNICSPLDRFLFYKPLFLPSEVSFYRHACSFSHKELCFWVEFKWGEKGESSKYFCVVRASEQCVNYLETSGLKLSRF